MSLLHELTRVECGKLDEDGMNRTLWSVVVREGFLGVRGDRVVQRPCGERVISRVAAAFRVCNEDDGCGVAAPGALDGLVADVGGGMGGGFGAAAA